MQSLENKKELQCFLGMINHLRKFVPDLSENTENLRKFLQKDTEWYWHPIAYDSRTLNKSEQNYCQLEKEILSIIFACTKFHDYMVSLFMSTMTIFHSNQYLQNLLLNQPHSFKDFSIYKSITLKCIICTVPY